MTAIDFSQVVSKHPSLKLRWGELRKKLKKIARRYNGAQLDLEKQTLHVNDPSVLEAVNAELMSTVWEVATRPYSGPEVVNRLSIRNSERVRWTKDQRLPVFKRSLVKRGQLVSVPTYATATIEALVAQPELIKEWRDRDSGALFVSKTA